MLYDEPLPLFNTSLSFDCQHENNLLPSHNIHLFTSPISFFPALLQLPSQKTTTFFSCLSLFLLILLLLLLVLLLGKSVCQDKPSRCRPNSWPSLWYAVPLHEPRCLNRAICCVLTRPPLLLLTSFSKVEIEQCHCPGFSWLRDLNPHPLLHLHNLHTYPVHLDSTSLVRD